MTVHLISLEELETRYTKEWRYHLPQVLRSNGLEVNAFYYGDTLEDDVSDGTSFLNWTSTNYFKSSQGMLIAEAIHDKVIKDGDVIFFADFWNPVILQTKYMLGMSGVDAKIAAIAHAGAYDQWDQLSQRLGTERWVVDIENALGHACDVLFFATEFHRNLFLETRTCKNPIVAGFPMEYISARKSSTQKEDIILFTQRNAPEKQPELFDDLRDEIKSRGYDYEFVNVQALGVDKKGYHEYLDRAKLVVSFALQETLGITPYEALARGCDILVPDRLSYSEMYSDDFKYPTNATIEYIADLVVHKMKNRNVLDIFAEYFRVSKFFNSKYMCEVLKDLQK